MSIIAYADAARKKSKGKVKSAIAERWNTRVIPQGLHNIGKAGASAYLDAYGKGVGAAKVVELAICAEHMGATTMAAGFWEAAYTLETGVSETFAVDGVDSTGPAVAVATRTSASNAPALDGFPSNLQPGLIQTMQPVDAEYMHGHYINDSNYLGQPKRDGHRNILFSTRDATFHQSRSTSGLGQISPDFENAAKAAAGEIGPFILDGERYYMSVTGSEHRTAAQAATANANAGQPTVLPVAVYGVFEALFANGRDLTNATKDQRIEAAAMPVAIIHSYLPANSTRIEAVPTARTPLEKRALIALQQAESREGEVWTQRNATYDGGKSHGTSVRTKYTSEGIFTITGVKLSSAANRSVASFELADENGNCGSVGTGFDTGTGDRLAAKHNANPGSVKVKVRYQGRTEGGSLWHSRFLEEA